MGLLTWKKGCDPLPIRLVSREGITMDNRPCFDCPDVGSCDKDSCYKYMAYLSNEAKHLRDRGLLEELINARGMPCADTSCYHNTDYKCTIPGYKGPTMYGSCLLYEPD